MLTAFWTFFSAILAPLIVLLTSLGVLEPESEPQARAAAQAAIVEFADSMCDLPDDAFCPLLRAA